MVEALGHPGYAARFVAGRPRSPDAAVRCSRRLDRLRNAGEHPVTQGFQQQSNDHNLNFSKTAPTPQHGAKASPEALKRQEQRPFGPKSQQQH
jgi:hypothetical protein